MGSSSRYVPDDKLLCLSSRSFVTFYSRNPWTVVGWLCILLTCQSLIKISCNSCPLGLWPVLGVVMSLSSYWFFTVSIVLLSSCQSASSSRRSLLANLSSERFHLQSGWPDVRSARLYLRFGVDNHLSGPSACSRDDFSGQRHLGTIASRSDVVNSRGNYLGVTLSRLVLRQLSSRDFVICKDDLVVSLPRVTP